MFTDPVKINIQAVNSGILEGFGTGEVPFYKHLTTESIAKNKTESEVPKMAMEINIHSVNCDINKFILGTFVLKKAELAVKSIEFQFLRNESVNLPKFKVENEISEIQNLQIGDGEVLEGAEVPIYMVFPRLFSSSTVRNKVVRLSFEVNLIVVFENGLIVTENVPINTFRS